MEHNSAENSADQPIGQTEQTRRNFFNRFHSKMLAMAMAGFLNLSVGWERSMAEQLKLTIPEKQDSTPEFSIEKPADKDKIKEFEAKLKQEEPEFMAWLDSYIDKIREALVSYEKAILEADENTLKASEELTQSNFNKYAQSNRFSPEQLSGLNRGLESCLGEGRSFQALVKKNPELIKDFNALLKDNLRNIFLSAIFLDNSKTTRDELIQIKPPVIEFRPSDAVSVFRPLLAYTDYIQPGRTEGSDDNHTHYQPKIVILPRAFYINENGRMKLDANSYTGVFMHELFHALKSTAPTQEQPNVLKSVLLEGEIERKTSATIGHLAKSGVKIKLKIGHYDDRVVLVSVLEAISKAQDEYDDTFSRWSYGIADSHELIAKIQENMNFLGFDDKITLRMSEMLETPVDRDVSSDSNALLIDLLSDLRSNDIKVSAELLGDILTKDMPVGADATLYADGLANQLIQSAEEKSRRANANIR